MIREVNEETLAKMQKTFNREHDEEIEQFVLDANIFVKQNAEKALTMLFENAIAYNPKAASMLVARSVNLIYQYHFNLMVELVAQSTQE